MTQYRVSRNFASDQEAKQAAERTASELGLEKAPVQLTLMTSSHARAIACLRDLMGKGMLKLYCYGFVPAKHVEPMLALMLEHRVVAESVFDLSQDARSRKMTFMLRDNALTVSLNMATPEPEELKTLCEVLNAWEEAGIEGDTEDLIKTLESLYLSQSDKPSNIPGLKYGPFELTVGMKLVSTSPRPTISPIAFVFSTNPLKIPAVEKLPRSFLKEEPVDGTVSIMGPLQPEPERFLRMAHAFFQPIQKPRFTFFMERAPRNAVRLLGERNIDENMMVSYGLIQLGVPEADYGVLLVLAQNRTIRLFSRQPLPDNLIRKLSSSLEADIVAG